MNWEYLEKMNQMTLKRNNMESDCCGASNLWDAGICSDCGEHAEFTNNEN